jgi:cellulose synthase/poly-beta-1,6-N-acetylglucosamine synthase-like glycosyltransferase
VVSVVYLTWRVCFTLGGNLWVSLPLWVLELYAAVGLGLFTFSLWNLDRQLVPAPVQQTDLRVGVLIPTYNEPIEVLFPTVAAAVALEPSHETYVLDDGQRLWVRAMAASLGARYIAREEHSHAKAGNVNHALAELDLDVVGILDADHIADAGVPDEHARLLRGTPGGRRADATGLLQPGLLRARQEPLVVLERAAADLLQRAAALLPGDPTGKEPLESRLLVWHERRCEDQRDR